MVDPQRVHWIIVKHLLHYLSGTMEYELLYKCSGGLRLAGFRDFDWAGCAEDNKSTSGCCFNIGSGIISRFIRKQKLVALISFEPEYMATSLETCEALWLRKILLGLFRHEQEAIVIRCDNGSVEIG
jgi:hypothetical protein